MYFTTLFTLTRICLFLGALGDQGAAGEVPRLRQERAHLPPVPLLRLLRRRRRQDEAPHGTRP